MKNTFCFLLVFHQLYCYSQKTQNLTEMVPIPAGKFIMGKDSERGANFGPAHTVYVDSFYMDEHEVTNRQYLEFCEATGYKLPEFWGMDVFHSSENYLDYPVVGINWYDAQKYAAWAGKRLPTEAEWEYAARGGLVQNEFPDGNTWDTPLRWNEAGTWENQTVQVKNFKPNGYGLFDMGGNVWEWVMDRYQYDYYLESPESNPEGPEQGGNRVIRGGGWRSGKMCHKVYFRKGLISNWVDFAVGFRCAKDVSNSNQ
jgi:iron(II)-dependent oxidoreductase